MGKIFDALEKADRQTASPGLPNRMPRPAAGDASPEEKIVPFAGASMHHPHDRQLAGNLIVYHSPQSVEADLFKVLRTNLLFPGKGTPPKSILVTSAVPGDGKSFVSANLAVSIAQGVEEHVLLLDFDIRRSSLHTMFGLGSVRGLSDHLSDRVPLEQLIHKTPIAKLSILPGGRPPRNPTELLSSKRMQAMLAEVTQRYEDRYVIIDSPPPSMAAEVGAIARNVDGILVVVRAGKTPRQAVAETIEHLGKEKILGIVLNQAQQSVKKYYGYNKTYYK